MKKFNRKHGILFHTAPPVPWCGFFGIIYVNEEYGYSIPYNDSMKEEVKHVYNGNYNKLCKFIFK